MKSWPGFSNKRLHITNSFSESRAQVVAHDIHLNLVNGSLPRPITLPTCPRPRLLDNLAANPQGPGLRACLNLFDRRVSGSVPKRVIYVYGS